MGTSNKHTGKIISTLYGVIFILSAVISSANAIPSAEDISKPAEAAKLATDTFMQESLYLRLGYEYKGEFATLNDKENLRELAKKARDDLEAIAQNQKKLKQQIEEYQGDDWDAKYGLTGLWRKLFADLYRTTLSKCEIDFYVAITAAQPEKNEILHKILAVIESSGAIYRSADSDFLKAKVLALLAQTEPACKDLAIEQLDSLTNQDGIPKAIYFRAVIEKIKLVGQTKPDQLDMLTNELLQSGCASDIELVLSLSFLQRRYSPEILEKTVRLWPQTEDLLASLILGDLSSSITQEQSREQTLQQTSVFEAELAVGAAWKNMPENHQTLLDCLSSEEKFQTPLILYVAAATSTESSPGKAVNLLLKASRLQQLQKSNKLDIGAERMAAQAAQLAYNLFTADSINCPLALEAFENYYTIAGKKAAKRETAALKDHGEIDEELEYFYSTVLSNCGLTEKGRKLLEEIANGPKGNWSQKAKLDLVVQAIKQKQHENKEQRKKLLEQLDSIISDCKEQNKNDIATRAEAINIYCQLLLESKDKACAQKVLDILGETGTDSDPNSGIFKSTALRQLGRLDESAEFLLSAIKPNSCEHTGEAMELLPEIIDEIDRMQENTDEPNFADTMRNCKKLAELCYRCLAGQQQGQAGLYLAEISVFAAEKAADRLSAVDKLLNDIAKNSDVDDADLLRCRARLLSKLGKFDEAAGLWARICEIRKSEAHSAGQRSWKWWQGKFYELDCCIRMPQTKKEDVVHTIEILENSFTDIPSFWAEKLRLLKTK